MGRHLRRRSLNGHAEMAEAQQRRAKNHRAPRAEVTIRDQPTEHWREVHERAVSGDNARRRRITKQKVFSEIKDQQRAHAVVTEPFPHLREEQHEQAAGVTDERRVISRVVRRGSNCAQENVADGGIAG